MTLATGPDPEALLTTALEKLLYLETRLESAEAAREEASRESARHQRAAAEARRALAEWQRRARDAQVQAESAERAAAAWRATVEARPLPATQTEAELQEKLAAANGRIERYDREREAWLDRMVSLSRLHDEDDDGLDLGSFIAELRSELMALKRGETHLPATFADRPPAPDAASLVAQAPTPEVDAVELLERARLSRPERTLARLCARDLESDSATVRQRAAERLAEANVSALNPVAQAKLALEPEAHVRVALLDLLARTGGASASLALDRALADPDPRVRAHAVEALARRGDEGVSVALADPSAAVRRRALARLTRDGRSLDALADALGDDDPSVRRVAALALAARPGSETEAVLQQAAQSADGETRALARQALTRRGQKVRPASSGGESELAANDRSSPAPDAALDARVVDEIRAALRGRTPDELRDRLGAPVERVSAAVERLVSAGTLVWRGRKLYQP